MEARFRRNCALATTRSRLAFTIPYILILAIAVRLGIVLTRQGRTSWRGALIVTGVAALLLFLQNLNGWPLWNASYDTNCAYSSFIALKIGSALLISIVTAITILVLPAAEPLYRESQPKQLQLAKVLTLRGLRSKEFFSAAVVGLVFRSRTHRLRRCVLCDRDANLELGRRRN